MVAHASTLGLTTLIDVPAAKALNIGATPLAWSLTDIRSIEPGSGINSLRLEGGNGSEVKLRVYRVPTWIAAIRDAQSDRVSGD